MIHNYVIYNTDDHEYFMITSILMRYTKKNNSYNKFTILSILSWSEFDIDIMNLLIPEVCHIFILWYFMSNLVSWGEKSVK